MIAMAFCGFALKGAPAWHHFKRHVYVKLLWWNNYNFFLFLVDKLSKNSRVIRVSEYLLDLFRSTKMTQTSDVSASYWGELQNCSHPRVLQEALIRSWFRRHPDQFTEALVSCRSTGDVCRRAPQDGTQVHACAGTRSCAQPADSCCLPTG